MNVKVNCVFSPSVEIKSMQYVTWKSTQTLKLRQSLTPVTLKIRQGQLCLFPYCIWSKATIMENLNGIHAIFEAKKCENPGIRLTFDTRGLENRSMSTISLSAF